MSLCNSRLLFYIYIQFDGRGGEPYFFVRAIAEGFVAGMPTTTQCHPCAGGLLFVSLCIGEGCVASNPIGTIFCSDHFYSCHNLSFLFSDTKIIA